jgi:hypothetical protein
VGLFTAYYGIGWSEPSSFDPVWEISGSYAPILITDVTYKLVPVYRINPIMDA